VESPEKATASGEVELHGVTVRSSGEPLSAERIAAVEKNLGHNLPAEYRSFLLHFNGGTPQPGQFRFTAIDPEDESRHVHKATVTWFYPATANESPWGVVQSLESVYNDLTACELPNWLLPIAVVDDAVAGGILCIAIEGNEQGRVYYRPEQEIGEDVVHLVADSFGSFLSLLGATKSKEPSWLAAIRKGAVNAVRDWLDRGGLVTSKYRNRSALVYAVADGRLEVVQLLLERGASPIEAYAYAMDEGQAAIVRFLLVTGAVVDVGKNALCFARTTLWNDLELVRALVDAGADVNFVFHDGTTPLHWAAQHAPPEVVKFLLARGAKPGIWSISFGQTALHRAVFGSPDEAVLAKMKLLIDAGEDLHALRSVGSGAGPSNMLASLLNRAPMPSASAADLLAAHKEPRLLQELERYAAQRHGAQRGE
jgi:hypothetical protein